MKGTEDVKASIDGTHYLFIVTHPLVNNRVSDSPKLLNPIGRGRVN